jgi:hypothetical protein
MFEKVKFVVQSGQAPLPNTKPKKWVTVGSFSSLAEAHIFIAKCKAQQRIQRMAEENYRVI